MFNPKLLSELLLKAKGSRSLNKFAKQCGISNGNLSKIKNCKTSRPPQAETLQKIAMHSEGNVSYEQLLNVCNYIGDDFRLSEQEQCEVKESINALRVKFTIDSKTVTIDNDELCPEVIESLLDAIGFAVEQAAVMNKILKNK